jgi:hypothetical protein
VQLPYLSSQSLMLAHIQINTLHPSRVARVVGLVFREYKTPNWRPPCWNSPITTCRDVCSCVIVLW